MDVNRKRLKLGWREITTENTNVTREGLLDPIRAVEFWEWNLV